MSEDNVKIEQMSLQIRNLMNENKALKLKIKENSNQGKMFDDLFHLLDDKDSKKNIDKNGEDDQNELK